MITFSEAMGACNKLCSVLENKGVAQYITVHPFILNDYEGIELIVGSFPTMSAIVVSGSIYPRECDKLSVYWSQECHALREDYTEDFLASKKEFPIDSIEDIYLHIINLCKIISESNFNRLYGKDK